MKKEKRTILECERARSKRQFKLMRTYEELLSKKNDAKAMKIKNKLIDKGSVDYISDTFQNNFGGFLNGRTAETKMMRSMYKISGPITQARYIEMVDNKLIKSRDPLK